VYYDSKLLRIEIGCFLLQHESLIIPCTVHLMINAFIILLLCPYPSKKVMGAIIEDRTEPALVMEFMDRGSLYDLLHNETMILEGELLLPILCDIAQGIRFLHAASPQVIHGRLSTQFNIQHTGYIFMYL